MKTKWHLWFLLVILSCGSPATNNYIENAYDPFEKIADQEAKDLLQNAIKAAGGLDSWNSLERISLQKHFVLLAEDGSIEVDQNQLYLQSNNSTEPFDNRFDGQPSVSYQLGQHHLQLAGEFNTNMTAKQLESTMHSASFVLAIPFNLLDDGAELSYEGKDNLDNGKVVETLRVDYKPGEHSNLTTPDIWWNYFDAETHEHVAYMVQHADHFSYVENLSTTRIDGILFPIERESWRVDKDRNKLWLRATYRYKY